MNSEIRRGEEAEQLLSNPIIVDAFAKLDDAIAASLRQANLASHQDLIARVAQYQEHEKFKRMIKDVVTTGKLAQQSEKVEEERQNWISRLKKRG